MTRGAVGLGVVSLLLFFGHQLASRPPAWLHDDPLSAPFGVPRTDHGQFEATGGELWPAEAPVEVEFPLDLNAATARQLEALPGIGPVMAKRILARRDSLGPFGSMEELDRVRGIGPVLLGKLSPLIDFSGNASDAAPAARPLQNANE